MSVLLLFAQSLILAMGVYFLFHSGYFALSIFSGYLYRSQNGNKGSWPKGIVVLLPAYRPSSFFLEVVRSVARAASPVPCKIFVLLQETDPEIARSVRQMEGVWVAEKSFRGMEGNAYHHALRYAVAEVGARVLSEDFPCSHLLLLDLDNMVDGAFLEKMTAKAAEGYSVVQGRRLPFGVVSNTQAYDAISEELNDWMFRASKAKLGLPIELSGSALLFEIEVFALAVERLDPRAPGMDKNLLVQMLLENPRLSMAYCPDAVVYEEKTEAEEGLERQRLRWFGNQYFNAWYYGWRLVTKALRSRVFGPADYAIALWRPPRSVQVVLLPILSLFEASVYAFAGSFPAFFPIFALSFLLTGIGLAIFILGSESGKYARKLAIKLPVMAFRNLLLAAMGSKKENQGKFVHTRNRSE
jgi:cellulose synthase/poly-beta-1,6-N-acetylglucosamine synthase-like glycosyltransferase